jgi:hypothetical protein
LPAGYGSYPQEFKVFASIQAAEPASKRMLDSLIPNDMDKSSAKQAKS